MKIPIITAVFAVFFCAVLISLLGRVTNIVEVRLKADCCFYLLCLLSTALLPHLRLCCNEQSAKCREYFTTALAGPKDARHGSLKYTHVVLCVDKDLAEGWLAREAVRRWHLPYQGTLLSQKYQRGDILSKGELISLEETVTIYRQRLYDISWLMRNLNEYIAREANKEDKCTGRFYSLPPMALTLRAS